MGQAVKDRSEICPLPPGPLKELPRHMRPRTIMAVGLTLMLTTTGLAYYLMQPTLVFLEPWEKRNYVERTQHAAIAIDGDANFSATALLEGWPGDGSPENPFIIESLDIDIEGGPSHCISISNTRVNFTIRNCNLTGGGCTAPWRGWGFQPLGTCGIFLENVTNGEMVNNTCIGMGDDGIHLFLSSHNAVTSNTCCNNTREGIDVVNSDSNSVTNNTCFGNAESGIHLYESNSNTVANNICVANKIISTGNHGIFLFQSDSNTMTNNTCNNAHYGIWLFESDFNTVADHICNNNSVGINLDESDQNTLTNNICTNNRIGIYIDDEPESNTVENNTFSSNTEHDIVYESELEELAHQEYVAKQSVWFLAGCGMVLVVAVIAFVQFRRMKL
jgi:parallel beta-helix repeat protein